MNLVKIAEDLKDLPLQAVQAYMNGLNPEVPPYMAQAEMMRRQKAMEKQKLAEGAQGQMPSVKEQLEQAAGLMALQQQRQQQGLQQMGQQAQAQPMPVQEPIPQPERQPEGGVAALDIPEETFAMAGGGIVGFQTGGSPSMYEQAYAQGERKGSIYDPYFGLPPEERARVKAAAEAKAGRPLDEQAASDRAFLSNLASSIGALNRQAGAAIADVATLPIRGLAGAYDTAVVRPMRAAGISAGYLSPLVTPEGADPASMTPFYDRLRSQGGQRQKADAARETAGLAARYPAPAQGPTAYTGSRLSPQDEQYYAMAARQDPQYADFWRAYTARFPDAAKPRSAPTAGAGGIATGAGRGGMAPPPMQAPQPALAPQAGLPAALPQGSAQQMSADLLKEVQGMEAPKVDLAAIGQQEQQLAQQTGLAGLAAQREAMRKQYEEATKDRAFETFLATMGGGARGFGGTGAAYLEAKKAARDADLGFAKRMYEADAAPVEKSYETQRDMLKEAQRRANEWAAEQRKAGIEIKKADIDRRARLELEEIEQRNRMGYLERQGQLFGGGKQTSAEGKLSDVEKAQIRALDAQIKAEQAKLKGYVPAAEKAKIEARIGALEQQRSALLGMPTQTVESSAGNADPLGIL